MLPAADERRCPASATPPVVIKLGGALITTGCEAVADVDRVLLANVAREIHALPEPAVVVHGTGSYGKPPAVRHGYLGGRLPAARAGVVAEVSLALARLELAVTEALSEAGLRPFRLPVWALYPPRPEAAGEAADGAAGAAGGGMLRMLLARGFTPVVGGNFILDAQGYAVCSSDVVARDLAIGLEAHALVMMTRERGVHRHYGHGEEIYDTLSPDDLATSAPFGPSAQDVSGGMSSKVAAAFAVAQTGIPTSIIDGRVAGNLAAALGGRPLAGTRMLLRAPAAALAS